MVYANPEKLSLLLLRHPSYMFYTVVYCVATSMHHEQNSTDTQIPRAILPGTNTQNMPYLWETYPETLSHLQDTSSFTLSIHQLFSGVKWIPMINYIRIFGEFHNFN